MARMAALATLMVGLLTAWAPAGPLLDWSPADDFRASPDHENPSHDRFGNADVWSYMSKSSNIRDGNYTLIDQYYKTGFQSPPAPAGLEAWCPDSSAPPPWAGKNVTGSPIAAGGAWNWPAGELQVHPPDGGLVVVGWQSPISGYVAADGTLAHRNPGGGNGINWFVDYKPVAGGYTGLASGSYGVGGSETFQTAPVPVSPGDRLYFVVDANGGYAYDATALNVHVRQVTAPVMSWRPAIDLSGLNPQPDAYGNPHVWHYMYKDNNTRDGVYPNVPFFDLTFGDPPISGLPNWNAHRPDQTPYVGQNLSGSDMTLYGTLSWPAGELHLHPPDNGLVVLAWESPIAGTVGIFGGLADRNPGGGNGINWYVEQLTGGFYQNLGYGSFPNGGSQLFSAGTWAPGVDMHSLNVNVGDFVYVIVDANGSHGWDSTALDLRIDAFFVVPEPSSMLLLMAGGAALFRRRRR